MYTLNDIIRKWLEISTEMDAPEKRAMAKRNERSELKRDFEEHGCTTDNEKRSYIRSFAEWIAGDVLGDSRYGVIVEMCDAK